MKTNAIIRIVLFSIGILILLGLLLSALAFHFFSFDSDSMAGSAGESHISVTPGDGSLSFIPEDVRNLEIEWVAGSIVIEPADVETITVTESEVSEEKYAMVWNLTNGKLTVQFCKESFLSGFGGITIHSNLSKDLYIQVPRDWECGDLQIDAASASVQICDLTIREVEFDGASGACEFVNCIVDTIDMDTASGDVRFSGTLNTLDFDGASASITAVLNNTPSRMDIDTMSGDLDLTLPQDTGFTVSMNAMSSDFSSDFETTTKNGDHVHGSGTCRINIDAMSGDVYIRKGE